MNAAWPKIYIYNPQWNTRGSMKEVGSNWQIVLCVERRYGKLYQLYPKDGISPVKLF